MAEEQKFTPEEIQEAASKVEVLLKFAATLVPHLEMLKETTKGIEDNSHRTLSAMPVLHHFGVDTDKKLHKNAMMAKRGRALVKLVETIAETIEEEKEFEVKQAGKAEMMDMLAKAGLV